ncbi:hypothetical protein BB560_002996 [Smittium megazygosporum]|uniref:Uncharacterized protein n=1 Tax=Smittium megazygosporum TaxID=133381 RepID=A0A2T9ZD68_9FUNG|nr:hypothetical protein BB560_002996 [Smittium megazygosporum]
MSLESKVNSGFKFVVNSFCPKILLVCSPAVQEFARKYNFEDFSFLLNPLAENVSLNSRIIDGDGDGYFLTSLTVQFISDCSPTKEWKPNKKTISEWISIATLSTSNINTSSDSIQPGFFSTPWYDHFRGKWVNLINRTNFESFNHPIITVLAASTNDDNPFQQFKDLLDHPQVQNARKSFFNGSEMSFYHILLSEQQYPGDEPIPSPNPGTAALFNELRNKLGENITLLNFDFKPLTPETTPSTNLWLNYYQSNEFTSDPNFKLGAGLSTSNLAEIRKALKQVISQGLISHMQRQVLILSDQTSSIRKGFAGRLFSAGRKYFSGASLKQSNKATDEYGEVYYTKESVEYKLRKLADYMFMLKGYKASQSIYSVASREFLSEQSNKAYASAQEMAGISKLLEPTRAFRDFNTNALNAINAYKKSIWQSELYGFRCVILFYELFKEKSNYFSAAEILQKVSNTSLHIPNALFLEQIFLVKLINKHFRKAVLYNRLAGEQYELGDQHIHAYRCYTNKINSQFYETWKSARSKSNILISNTAKHLNAQIKLFECYRDLVNDFDLEEPEQQKYLDLLIDLYNSEAHLYTKAEGPSNSEFQFPIILLNTIQLVSSPEGSGEDCIMKWADPNSKPLKESTSYSTWCSPGEFVSFHIVIENPLKIPITLANVRLGFDFILENSLNSDEFAISAQPSCSLIPFVVLEPMSKFMLEISIQCVTCGTLFLRELLFELFSTIPIKKSLQKSPHIVKQSSFGGPKISQSDDSTNCPKIIISSNLPKLNIVMENSPDMLFAGEHSNPYLVISNDGSQNVESVVLWMSHPEYFYIDENLVQYFSGGTANDNYLPKCDIFKPFPGQLASDKKLDYSITVASNMFKAGSLNQIKLHQPLAPGDKMAVPIHFQCNCPDSYIFEFIVGYSTQTVSNLFKSCKRSFRFEVLCDIEPFLSLSTNIRLSKKHFSKHIFSVTVQNKRKDTSVNVDQLSFFSSSYKLVPLSTLPSIILPGQSVSITFYVETTDNIPESELLELQNQLVSKIQQFINSGHSKKNARKSFGSNIPVQLTTLFPNNSDTLKVGLESIEFLKHLSFSKKFHRRKMFAKSNNFYDKNILNNILGVYSLARMDLSLFWHINGFGDVKRGSIYLFDLEVESLDLFLEGKLKLKENSSNGLLLKVKEIEKTRSRAAKLWNTVTRPLESMRASDTPVHVSLECFDKDGLESTNYIRFSSSDKAEIRLSIKCTLKNAVKNLGFKYVFSLDNMQDSLVHYNKGVMDNGDNQGTLSEQSNNKEILNSPFSNTPGLAGETEPEQIRGSEYSEWSWVGFTQFEGEISGDETKVLDLSAICYGPGTVDLNQWHLTIDPVFQDEATYKNVSGYQEPLCIEPTNSKFVYLV